MKQKKNLHKYKTKLARKMRSRQEVKDHVGIFLSKSWNERYESRLKKGLKKKK